MGNINTLNGYSAYTSRVETEMSVAWATNNPDLFLESWQSFYRDFDNAEWKIRSKTTKGTITFVAEKVAA